MALRNSHQIGGSRLIILNRLVLIIAVGVATVWTSQGYARDTDCNLGQELYPRLTEKARNMHEGHETFENCLNQDGADFEVIVNTTQAKLMISGANLKARAYEIRNLSVSELKTQTKLLRKPVLLIGDGLNNEALCQFVQRLRDRGAGANVKVHNGGIRALAAISGARLSATEQISREISAAYALDVSNRSSRGHAPVFVFLHQDSALAIESKTNFELLSSFDDREIARFLDYKMKLLHKETSIASPDNFIFVLDDQFDGTSLPKTKGGSGPLNQLLWYVRKSDLVESLQIIKSAQERAGKRRASCGFR